MAARTLGSVRTTVALSAISQRPGSFTKQSHMFTVYDVTKRQGSKNENEK